MSSFSTCAPSRSSVLIITRKSRRLQTAHALILRLERESFQLPLCKFFDKRLASLSWRMSLRIRSDPAHLFPEPQFELRPCSRHLCKKNKFLSSIPHIRSSAYKMRQSGTRGILAFCCFCTCCISSLPFLCIFYILPRFSVSSRPEYSVFSLFQDRFHRRFLQKFEHDLPRLRLFLSKNAWFSLTKIFRSRTIFLFSWKASPTAWQFWRHAPKIVLRLQSALSFFSDFLRRWIFVFFFFAGVGAGASSNRLRDISSLLLIKF